MGVISVNDDFINLKFSLGAFIELEKLTGEAGNEMTLLFYVGYKFGTNRKTTFSEAQQILDDWIEEIGFSQADHTLERFINESLILDSKNTREQVEGDSPLITALAFDLTFEEIDKLTPKEIGVLMELRQKKRLDESELRSYETYMALVNVEGAKAKSSYRYKLLHESQNKKDKSIATDDAQNLLEAFDFGRD